MMHVWKNLVYEFDRFWKWFIFTTVFFVGFKFLTIYLFAFEVMTDTNETMERNRWSISEYVRTTNKDFSLDYYNSAWFILSVAIPFFFLFVYTFLIWYKDWLGKNISAYKMYMIPQSRASIYTAKLLLIIGSTLFFVGLQFALFSAEIKLLQSIIPAELLPSLSIENILRFSYAKTFLPLSALNFVIIYTSGFAVILYMFWFILIERSYRLRIAILVTIIVFLVQTVINTIMLEAFGAGIFHFINNIGTMEYFVALLLVYFVSVIFFIGHSIYLLRKKIII